MKKSNNKEIIPVVFTFDTNYVIPAAVTFYSLLEFANKEYIYKFYVLHSDITEEQQQKLHLTIQEYSDICDIEFIFMGNKYDEIWQKIYKGGHFSKEVMYKILLASIFPQYEKVIVSDVDVVFLGDISESYRNFDSNSNNYFATVKSIGKLSYYLSVYEEKWSAEEIQKIAVFCGGYLVANLRQIRKDKMEEVFVSCFEKEGHRLNQMEQDVLNLCCYNKVEYLPLNYVACTYLWEHFPDDESRKTDSVYSYAEITSAMEKPIQLHYATGVKPWKDPGCLRSEVWYKYIVKTPFLEEFLKKLPEQIVCSENNINYKRQTNARQKIRKNYNFLKKITKYIYHRVRRIFYKLINFMSKNSIVIIFDAIFPTRYSPFIYEEFTYYNEKLNKVHFMLNGKDLLNVDKSSSFQATLEEYQKDHRIKYNIFPFENYKKETAFENKMAKYSNKLIVATFLNNLINDSYDVVKYAEENNIPFVFTLYPGGGFILNNKEVNEKLKKIFSSKMFRKVITTQKVTYDYLVENKLCPRSKIHRINGVVTPREMLNKSIDSKIYFNNKNKNILNVAFVAYKYEKIGIGKGYDVFIESAKQLYRRHKNIKFHVVGNFDETDIDVVELGNNIIFYGPKKSDWFSEFYRDIDVIVATNKANKKTGVFDGFPTACVTEAALNGVLIMSSDALNQNQIFVNKQDIILIKNTASSVVKEIDWLLNNPEQGQKIARRGYSTVNKHYSEESQLKSRLKIIERELRRK